MEAFMCGIIHQRLYGSSVSLYEQHHFNSRVEAQVVLCENLPCSSQELKEAALTKTLEERVQNVVDIHWPTSQEDTGCYLVDKVVYVKCKHTEQERLTKQAFWKQAALKEKEIEHRVLKIAAGCFFSSLALSYISKTNNVLMLGLAVALFVSTYFIVIVFCLGKSLTRRASWVRPIEVIQDLEIHPAHLVAKLRTQVYQQKSILYAQDKDLIGQSGSAEPLNYKFKHFNKNTADFTIPILNIEINLPLFSPSSSVWELGFRETNSALKRKYPNDPFPGVSGKVIHPQEEAYLKTLATVA